MTPPKYPENPAAEKRDHELRALFEKVKKDKEFKESRRGTQDLVNITVLNEADEEETVEVIFKDNYDPAKYTTVKEKPTIEDGKTHLLLGNVDSDAFDSNLERGPEYYQDLKRNAVLFTELKDYVDINFPAFKDPAKKARMLEMIDKTRFLGSALNAKSFKEFCAQNNFKKTEVFGKTGLYQVLIAFSRAIEPVENRALLKVENFKITDTNPNPLFYRIELGIGKSGSTDKDRFSIVLKSGLNGETVEPEESEPEDDAGKGVYVPGDIYKLQAPPDDDEEEESPADPVPPSDPAQPAIPATPAVPSVEPVTPSDPNAPTPPDATPPAPPIAPADPAAAAPDPAAAPAPADPAAAPPADPAAAPPADPAAAPPADPADTPTPDAPPTAALNTVQHDIKLIDDVDTKLETNAPDGFKFELTPTDFPSGYKIAVSFTNPTRPDDPAKTGLINFCNSPFYKTNDPANSDQFWYSFSSTPGTASNLDIWKFYALKTNPEKPSITISKLATSIAIPSINYNKTAKEITVFPDATSPIGGRKRYGIEDPPGQTLKFEYFNDDGTQSLQVTTADENLTGQLNVATGNSEPTIPESDPASYDTDIFQHYDFTFTEGPGSTPGTLKITKKPEDIKETTHEITTPLDIDNDASTEDESTKFTLTIKAPGNQARTVETKNQNDALPEGVVKVQFGGLTGFFKIKKPATSGPFAINFQNYIFGSDQSHGTPSSQNDLWNNYKAILDFANKTITIEKLEKKPLPRLEYDETSGMVTFFKDDNGKDSFTSYQLNKPDDVKVFYQNRNGEYFLELRKVELVTWILSSKEIEGSPAAATNLWSTHDITFSEDSDPKTITIAEKAPAVAPPPNSAPTTATTFRTRLAADPAAEAEAEAPDETAIFPFGNLIFKFPGATVERIYKEDTIELKTDEGSYTIELSFTGEASFVGKDANILTHTISSTCDDNNECLVAIIPAEPLAGAEAPAPPAEAPAPPAAAPAPLAEAPPVFVDKTMIEFQNHTFAFAGTAEVSQDLTKLTLTPKGQDKKFTVINSGGQLKLEGDASKTHTLKIEESGSEKIIQIKPAIVSQVEVSPAKDKITITLDNEHKHEFALVLPAKYKDKITFSVEASASGQNRKYLRINWKNQNAVHAGYINFRHYAEYSSIWDTDFNNIGNNIANFFKKEGPASKDAPFGLEFKKGDAKSLPTITIISHKETEELANATAEAAEKIKHINTSLIENLYFHQYPTYNRNYMNSVIVPLVQQYVSYTPTAQYEVESVNNLQVSENNISAAAKALTSWEQKALDQIPIQVGKETKLIGEKKLFAFIAYSKLGNQADIMDELKKIIGFYFHTWDAKDTEALNSEEIKTFRPETIGEKYGNFYSSPKFQSGRLNEYNPEEGDYMAIIFAKPKIVPYDSPWYKVWELDGHTLEGNVRAVSAIYKFEDGRWKLIIGKDADSGSQAEEVEF